LTLYRLVPILLRWIRRGGMGLGCFVRHNDTKLELSLAKG
jgi:hypothetical protein